MTLVTRVALCLRLACGAPLEAPPSLVARSFVARSSVQAAPRPAGSLCLRLACGAPLEAPPSLVARSFVARSSVQAAPRPAGSLCLRLACGAPPASHASFAGPAGSLYLPNRIRF